MHVTMRTIALTILLSIVAICGSQRGKSSGDWSLVPREWPYLQNEAEFWSFDNQIQENLKFYSLKVENFTKYYIIEREQHNARLPTFNKKLSIKGASFELKLTNGRLKGLDGIKVTYEHLRAYEGLEVLYTSQMTFSNDIKVLHDYSIMKGGTGFRGKLEGLIEGLKYYAHVRFNLKTQQVKIDLFDLRCYSRIEVQNITNIPENWAQIVNEIKKAATELYSTAILADAKTLTGAALGEGFAGSSIAEFLPQFNYSIDYLKGVQKYENFGHAPQCRPDFKERKEPTVIEIKGVAHVGGRPFMKFIQNEAEMSAYLRLLNSSLKYYVEDYVTNIVQDLTNRKLTKIKLPPAGVDIVTQLKDGKVQTGTLHLTNGWITNPFNFESVGVTLVQIVYDKMMITWRMNIHDTLEYTTDYDIEIWGDKVNGTITAKVDILPFLVRQTASLSTFDVELTNVLRECQLVDNIEVTGLGEMASGLTGYIQYNVKHSFGSAVLDSVYQELLVQGIQAAKYMTDFKSYLPKWDYNRDFTGEKDDGKIAWEMKICENSEMEKLLNKTYDYAYVSNMNMSLVPFVQNEIELKAFGKELRRGLDKYFLTVMYEAGSIITIQDLKKAKVTGRNVTLDYVGPLGNSWSGELSLNNSWIEDLSDIIRWPKIDLIKFNPEYAMFTADIPLWRSLKFSSDFTVQLNKEPQQKGNLSTDIFDLVYSIAVRMDNKSPKIHLEEMKFKCLKQDSYIQVDGLEGPTQFHLGDEISRVTKETSIVEAMQTSWDLFRRALEDSISKNNIRNFLPRWNYRKNYDHTREKKPRDYFKPCDSTKRQGLHIPKLYKNEKLIAFEDFHKILQTEALRRSMEKRNPSTFKNYANDLWNSLWRDTLDYYVTMELPDRELMFVAKDANGLEHSVTMELTRGEGGGISNVERFRNIAVAHAENDTVVIVQTENIRQLSIYFDYKLYVSGELKGNGTIKGELNGLEFLLKLRLYFTEFLFVVEDYDIFCFKEYTLEIPGLTEGNEWLKKYAEDEVTSLYMGPVLDDIVNVRGEMFKNSKKEVVINYYFPEWMAYNSSYSIAISNETDPKRIEKRTHLLQTCDTSVFNNTDTSHVEYRGDVPYIKNEAQWWYFDRKIKQTMRMVLSTITGSSRWTLKDNELNKLDLPEYERKFMTKIPGGVVNAGEMRFVKGLVEDLSEYVTLSDLNANSNLKLENSDAIFTSYIKFDNLKITGEVETKVGDSVIKGTAEGKVKELSYSFIVRIHLKTKALKLEEMKLACVRGIEFSLDGFSDAGPPTPEKITGILKELFLGPILDDVHKVLHVIFDITANHLVPITFQVPSWNYDLGYSKNEKPGGLVVDDRYKLCDFPPP